MGLQGNESLQSLLEDEHPERLARAALLLGSDVQPGLDIDPYLQRLHRYAETIGERLAPYSRLGDVLFHLNDFLFNDCGFHTNTNYARSAELNYLHRVMDSRCGTPLSIAIIYLTIGRWLGL
ncbi:MAG TPA: transglutaminase family protein, partial [Gammaproteobacteria bacterium]